MISRAWPRVLAVLVAAYVVLLAVDGVTRRHRFTPDSMNYTDVARHVRAGKGISQATVSYNQPHFALEAVAPVAMTTQAPLYPLLMAALGLFGVSLETAAVLVPALAGGLVLLLLFVVARRAYDADVACLSVALAAAYVPLRVVSTTAWSETLGTSFVLLSLWLAGREDAGPGRRLAAGLGAGLALATRYALCPVALTGPLLLWERGEVRASVRRLLPYGIGAAIPLALVVGRNVALTGSLVGWHANPSPVGLGHALRSAARATFGQYVMSESPRTEVAILAAVAVLAAVALSRRAAARAALQELARTRLRLVLLVWSFGYLLWLAVAATWYPIDEINARFIVPATVVLLIPLASLVAQVLGRPRAWAGAVATLVVALAIGREAYAVWSTPPYTRAAVLARSERLAWLAGHLSPDDLVIGEDVMDVPFYFGSWSALSYSPYPLTDFPQYAQLVAWIGRHGAGHPHAYLVLRESDEAESRRLFGPFIADLAAGRLDAYPALAPAARLRDATIYEFKR